MKKKILKEKILKEIEKEWHTKFEFNKILWILSNVMATFAGEEDRAVTLKESTKEKAQENKKYLFDVLKGILICFCKELKLDDEDVQDTIFTTIAIESVKIQKNRLTNKKIYE